MENSNMLQNLKNKMNKTLSHATLIQKMFLIYVFGMNVKIV